MKLLVTEFPKDDLSGYVLDLNKGRHRVRYCHTFYNFRPYI